jgi:hypothetical protein
MADAYRIRSEETWAEARSDYLAGFTAEDVCRRYDIGLSALRLRARRERWRRADGVDPSPADDDLDLFADVEPDDMVEMARLRMVAAISRGQSTEAARWGRIYRDQRTDRDTRELLEMERRMLAAAARPPSPRPATAASGRPAPDRPDRIVHDVHSKILPDPAEPSPSRQVRRRLAREAAKRS